jgi:hypothetical protein
MSKAAHGIWVDTKNGLCMVDNGFGELIITSYHKLAIIAVGNVEMH